MYTIAVANQKGGSGKTTTAVNFSAALVKKGYKVLLADIDPQAQASTYLRYEEKAPKGSIFDLLLETKKGESSFLETLIPVYRGLALLPSGNVSVDDEVRLGSQPGRNLKLAEVLGQARKDYDFAVIDCPPTLGVLTRNALMASNAVLLTVETSFFALHGVGKMLELIQDIRKEHAIRIFTLATMYDGRTTFAREVLDDMRGYFKDMMLSTVIRQNTKLKESTSFGVPIFGYAKHSHGAEDYSAMTDELLKKVVQGINEMRSLIPTAVQGPVQTTKVPDKASRVLSV